MEIEAWPSGAVVPAASNRQRGEMHWCRIVHGGDVIDWLNIAAGDSRRIGVDIADALD
jgi:hypothetical protein